MNQLIHTSPTLVLHQLGWGIPHAVWRNHAYAFYLDSITNGNGNTKFSLALTVVSAVQLQYRSAVTEAFILHMLPLFFCL